MPIECVCYHLNWEKWSVKSSVLLELATSVSQTVPENAGQGGEGRLLNHDIKVVGALIERLQLTFWADHYSSKELFNFQISNTKWQPNCWLIINLILLLFYKWFPISTGKSASQSSFYLTLLSVSHSVTERFSFISKRFPVTLRRIEVGVLRQGHLLFHSL